MQRRSFVRLGLALAASSCHGGRPARPGAPPPAAIDLQRAHADALALALAVPDLACRVAPAAFPPSIDGAARRVLAPGPVWALRPSVGAAPSRKEDMSALGRWLVAAFLQRESAPEQVAVGRALAAPLGPGYTVAALAEALSRTAEPRARADLLQLAEPALRELAVTTSRRREAMTRAGRNVGLDGERDVLAALYPGESVGVIERAQRLLAMSATIYGALLAEEASREGTAMPGGVQASDVPRLLAFPALEGDEPAARALAALARHVGLERERPHSAPGSLAAAARDAHEQGRELYCGHARAASPLTAPAASGRVHAPAPAAACGARLAALVIGRLTQDSTWLAEHGVAPITSAVRAAVFSALAALRRDAALLVAAVEASGVGSTEATAALGRRLSEAYGVALSPGLAALIQARAPPFWCVAAHLDATLAAAAIEARLVRDHGSRWWDAPAALALLRRIRERPYPDPPDTAHRLDGAALDVEAFLAAAARALMESASSGSPP